MAEEAQLSPPAGRQIASARLATGFAQGVVLLGLSQASTRHVWPATLPPLYGALALVLTFAPVIVIGGLGRIRTIPLAAWTLIAAVILAVFAWHDIDAGIWSGLPGLRPRLMPAFQVFLFGGIFVFVGHHLVGPADEARKLVAPYPLYFDWAWKDAVQIGLSLAFVGVLWAALELGGALFGLIGIDAVGKLLQRDWFYLPVCFTAFAAAVQLTDVRVALIRGVRTVGLVLLSWLLPVMTVIVLAFLAALPFTGLAPLFNTRSGASTVLSASAALVVLLSAAYEDGASPTPVVLRWAGRAAALAMVPLVLIAADALWLRVSEYGLTPPRIEAIACAMVAAGFAAGYARGAIQRRGPWMKSVELTNVIMARVVMLAILLIFTPIADPARLAVGDQMSRLLAGKTPPAKFDFDFLRFRAGQYGAAALTQIEGLKGSPSNLALAQQATNAVKSDEAGGDTTKTFAQRLTVYPKGASAGRPGRNLQSALLLLFRRVRGLCARPRRRRFH
jgi:Domain of unknown function (DUF4153)